WQRDCKVQEWVKWGRVVRFYFTPVASPPMGAREPRRKCFSPRLLCPRSKHPIGGEGTGVRGLLLSCITWGRRACFQAGKVGPLYFCGADGPGCDLFDWRPAISLQHDPPPPGSFRHDGGLV